MSVDFVATVLWIVLAFWPIILIRVFADITDRRGAFAHRLVTGIRGTSILWGVIAAIWMFLVVLNRPPTSFLIQEPANTNLFWGTGLVLIAISLVSASNDKRAWGIEVENIRTVRELRSLSPIDFERFVAQSYQHMGYKVKIVGAQGDHGVDLIIDTLDGEKWIVQCKRWKGKIGEPIVRDFFGAMQHEYASRGFIITTGSFTAQAIEWAKGKKIYLYDGEGFLAMLTKAGRQVVASPSTSVTNTLPFPKCPECGGPMVLRVARNGVNQGKRFYGCSNYPQCKGIVPID